MKVSIFRPQSRSGGIDFECRYAIEWLSTRHERRIGGVDAVQALLLAMQSIAAELYSGRFFKLEDLTWLEPEQGFGFPLPPSLRDLAIGEDRRF